HVEQTPTVYEEVGRARTRQDPNGTSEATAGGNTIYAVICTKTQGSSRPPDPGSCTIYSTIQPTRKSSSLKKKLDPALVSTAYVEVTGSRLVGRGALAHAQHGPSEVVGVVGGVAYLSPSLGNRMSYHQIHWRRDNSVKIAIWDSKETVRYPNNIYKGRLELFPNNTLKISYLQKNDSSVYQVYLEDQAGKEHIENILLTVYDLVPKPTVHAKVMRDDSGRCKATLECSVGLEGVTYEWITPSKLLPEGAGSSKQNVSFDPLTEIYICKVSNPVSSNNASLTYWHPCSWTGESSAAASCTTTRVLVHLGQLLLLLLFLLNLA
ncbi:PREDICTED: CD48 antigen-like, partial [Pterocles gutturalis]|uniref:CD48 antigen-like n=1 Tax=Pterocles gutturalis TaxID=240206 RepID=UPI000528F75B